MIRDFMGISKDAIVGTPAMHDEMFSTAATPSGAEAVAPTSAENFTNSEEVLGRDGVSNGPNSKEDKSSLEAHVGYQAGILSSAFSVSQV